MTTTLRCLKTWKFQVFPAFVLIFIFINFHTFTFAVPKDFQSVLTRYTRDGYRVIAVATKRIDLSFVKLQKVDRDKIENDLTFLGLIIMENRLKPETTSVINRLSAANVRTIMCTGDNILTGLSVARDCDMISEDDRVIVIEANEGEDPRFVMSKENSYYNW